MPVHARSTIATGDAATISAPVDARLFGGIFKKHDQLDGTYGEKLSALGLTHIRYPGGTQAEQAPWYGLEHPDLVADGLDDNGDGRADMAGLSEVMGWTAQAGLGLTVVLPTARYAADPAQGAADYAAFVADLAAGAFGPVPDDLTLEVGNEYFAQPQLSQGAPDGLSKFRIESLRAETYGRRAAELVNALDAELAQTGPQARIAVQAGRASDWHDALIRGALERSGAIDAVDKVVLHDFPWTYEEADDSVAWQQSVAEAWSKAAGGRELALSLSATNITSRAAADGAADWGAAQAPALVNLIAAHAVAGADDAAFYGVQNAGGAALSAWEGGDDLTAGGQAVRLMSDSLPGTRVLEVSAQDQDAAAFRLDAFEDDSKLVLFASANDAPDAGDVAPGGRLEIDLDGLSAAPGHVWAERIVTRPDGSAVTERFIPAHDGTRLSLDLDEPDQLVRVIVAKGDPGQAPLELWGDGQDDRMQGGAGDDLFHAGAGADRLSGGGGHDILIGGAGDDRIWGGDSFDRLGGWNGDDALRGGAGRDRLYGGSGNDDLRGNRGIDVLNGGAGDDVLSGGARPDRFQFRAHDGSDRITDFELGSDRLELLGKLDPGDVTVAEETDDGLLLQIGPETQVFLDGLGREEVEDAIADDSFFF